MKEDLQAGEHRASNTTSHDGTLNEVAEVAVEAVRPPPEDLPPNGGYGWVCVVAVALINAHTWGINSSYGVFLAYYLSHNTFDGASTLEFAFVGGLSIASALLVAPLATVCVAKLGTRITLFIGVFLQTLSLLGASFASQIWQLFLSQGVCFGLGMGFLFVGSVGIVAQWFTTKRSLANGLAACGSGFGGLIYSLSTNAIITRISLGWAFRILAIVSCAVLIICSLLVRDRNKQVGASVRAFDKKLVARKEYLLLLAWGFFSMLGYIVLLFSLPNYAKNIGLTARQGSVVGALLNLGQGLGENPQTRATIQTLTFPTGRGPIGYYSDTVGRINMAMSGTFLCGILCFAVWIPSSSFAPLVVFALVVGPVAGIFWGTVAPVTAEVVGIVDLTAALSITWVTIAIPCTFSEVMALEIAQKSSLGYLGTQLFAGFMYMAAGIALYCVRVWKIGHSRRIAGKLANGGSEKLDASAGMAVSAREKYFAWTKV